MPPLCTPTTIKPYYITGSTEQVRTMEVPVRNIKDYSGPQCKLSICTYFYIYLMKIYCYFKNQEGIESVMKCIGDLARIFLSILKPIVTFFSNPRSLLKSKWFNICLLFVNLKGIIKLFVPDFLKNNHTRVGRGPLCSGSCRHRTGKLFISEKKKKRLPWEMHFLKSSAFQKHFVLCYRWTSVQ